MNIKKIAAAALATVMITAAIPFTAGARTIGEGGKFNTADATTILKHVVGIEELTGDDFKAADVDGDGNVTTKDATYVLKKVLGLPIEDEDYVTIQGVKYDIATTSSIIVQGLTKTVTSEDVENVAKLKNLTELTMSFAKISDISSIAELKNLTKLSLHANDISDISPLAGLTNLKSLDLHWNQISDISPLAKLTNLEELSLRGNQISDISPLIGLTNLTELYVYDNQISDSDMESLKSALPNCNII